MMRTPDKSDFDGSNKIEVEGIAANIVQVILIKCT